MLNETLKEIKDNLETYDVILLTGKGGSGEDNLAGWLLNSQTLHEFGKKVLVLPADKYKVLAGLYYTYEFSDKIRVVGGKNRHGGLMNYLALGLLTEQEIFEAILR